VTDVARIAEAISRPGIDPRSHVTLAVVDAVKVTAVGVYCDVTTIHGLEETASYAPVYGGASFGFHAPIEEGSFVVIAIPEGEHATGARIIAHVWDQGQPPPQVVVDHPTDVALVVKRGQTMRIVCSGGGNIVIQAEDDGTVLLGNEAADRGAARIDDEVSLTALGPVALLQPLLDARYAVANPTVNIATGPIAKITSGSDKVKLP
jgi:hypothetical protein